MNQYDSVADDYARLIAPKYAPIAALAADRVTSRGGRPASVVELAAGTGTLTRLLAPWVLGSGDYLAVDISPEMLRNARATVDPRVSLLVADLAAVPVTSDSADLVVCSLGPLQDTEEGWAEAGRILRPGGRLVLVTWGSAYAELDLIRATRRRLGEDEYFPASSIEDIVRHADRAGFIEVQHENVCLPVEHASVAAYLDYRQAFGRPAWVPDDRLAEVLEAIAIEAQHYTDDRGRVILDWMVTVVDATWSGVGDAVAKRLDPATV